MKEKCKNCPIYEAGTCKCKNCNDICKCTTPPSDGKCPQDNGRVLQQPIKSIFADLKNEITNLNDKELRSLISLVNNEWRKRRMQSKTAAINKKKKENQGNTRLKEQKQCLQKRN